MVKSCLRIVWRTLLKNKGYSFINVGGLAIGMACFILLTNYVRFERSYEDFHKNAENIFRVTLDLYKGSEYVITDCETHAPFGPMVKEKMPEVVDFVRMMHNDDRRIKIGTKKFFEEHSYFADPSVFTVFSFSFLQGNPMNALSEPYQIVLTKSAAKKYFGREGVIGESVELGLKPYKVTAIIENVPDNTHLKFDFLASHATIHKFSNEYSDESWGTGNNEYTYLLMKPQVDLVDFNKKLAVLSASLKARIGAARYKAEPIENIHLYSNKTFEPDVNGNAKMVYFLLIISISIIVLAWVNYINLSTAKAIERGREVGIRKIMGSLQSQLIGQFLLESIIINSIASSLAFVLVELGYPYFRELSGVPLPAITIQDPKLWYLLLGLLGIGVIFSGLYPAIVLSSFEPITVLKGKFRSSIHGQLLRKGLVVFQFSATVLLIVCLCTVYLQINHLRKYDLGMEIEQTLILRTSDINVPESIFLSKYHSLKNELIKNTSVKIVARSGSVPGLALDELSTTGGVVRVGKDKYESYNYYTYPIDADYIPALGIKVVAGRNFKPDAKNANQVIINEQAVKTLGFASAEAAIGERITYFGTSTIVGVVKNFSQRSPKEAQYPMIFWYNEGADFFIIKLRTDGIRETLRMIKKNWDEVFSSSAFNYFFLDEKYNQQYKADAQFGEVIAVFSIIAVFIACLGLFGLSSFTILQRTKEIGIRKVLGGSVMEIVQLLSKDYVTLVMLAGVTATPFSYFLMERWLSNYAVRISLNIWLFLIPLFSVLLISLLTISVQTLNAARANPVESLRNE
jgi:putative ABC transport system permease protein